MKATATLKVAKLGERDILLTREFDAPRALVFRALTDPTLIPKWWGRRGHTTAVDRMHVRPGGAWRFIERDSDGKEFPFRGVYREVEAPGRLVYTFEFEPMPGYVSLETVRLEERGGRTSMTNTVAFHTTGDRDGMIDSGMEDGAAESMDKLADLLVSMLAGDAN
jgi:uncharacterized protein YndB with AHSA1/START domain